MKPNQELWFSIQLRVRQEVWSTNLSEVNFGRNEKEMGWQIRSSTSHLRNQRVHVSQIRHLRLHISINALLNNNQNDSISFLLKSDCLTRSLQLLLDWSSPQLSPGLLPAYFSTEDNIRAKFVSSWKEHVVENSLSFWVRLYLADVLVGLEDILDSLVQVCVNVKPLRRRDRLNCCVTLRQEILLEPCSGQHLLCQSFWQLEPTRNTGGLTYDPDHLKMLSLCFYLELTILSTGACY